MAANTNMMKLDSIQERISEFKVTATAVFTTQQALMAAKAGADFVAPYVNRVDNIAGDGVQLVADIVRIFTTYRLKTEVLAASFKNVGQVHHVCLAGAAAVTVGEEVFKSLTAHPLTDGSVAQFIADWEKEYGLFFRSQLTPGCQGIGFAIQPFVCRETGVIIDGKTMVVNVPEGGICISEHYGSF